MSVNRWSRAGGSGAVALVLLVAGGVLAEGASVSIDVLVAEWEGPAVEGAASSSVSVDLSEGQQEGLGTIVTLLPGNPILWVGSFDFEGGAPLTMNYEATLQLEVGGLVAAVTKQWEFYAENPGNGGGGGAVTNPVGYSVGPEFEAISLVVGPGTDLSDVKVTLLQTTSISGNSAHFLLSSVGAANITDAGVDSPPIEVLAVSVPELEVAGLLVFGVMLVARRRRAMGVSSSV